MPIEIIIKGSESADTVENPTSSDNNETGGANQDKELKGKDDKSRAIIRNFLVQSAKKSLITGIQSYAKYTNNTYMAQQLTMAVELAGTITGIATSFVAGGWILGLVSIATTTVGYVIEGVNMGVDIDIQNRNLSIARLGLGTINRSGGRYGA